MKTNIDMLKSIAPTLAVALEGSFVSAASKFIIDKLVGDNIDKGESTDEIIGSLLTDTENLKKIKAIEEEFKLEMKELGVDVFTLKTTDNTNVMKVVKTNILPQIIISTLFLVAYFILLGAIFYIEVSDTLNMRKGENSLLGQFQILFGVLTAGVGQILGFWFSSSPQNPLSRKSLVEC